MFCVTLTKTMFMLYRVTCFRFYLFTKRVSLQRLKNIEQNIKLVGWKKCAYLNIEVFPSRKEGKDKF